MKFFNVTRGTTAFTDIEDKNSLVEKSIGLLRSQDQRGIYFETRWGIHTFFMKFPIDVVVLDDVGVVRLLVPHLKSWRLLFWNPQYGRVLELPAGSIERSGVVLQDRLEVEA